MEPAAAGNTVLLKVGNVICSLYSPAARCQGKREWFSQFSFYFVDIKDGKIKI